MSFKKTLALCLSLIVLGCCAITGTLAFPSFLTRNGGDDGEGKTDLPSVKVLLDIQQDSEAQMFPGIPLKKEVSLANSQDSDESIYVWYTCKLPSAMYTPDSIATSPITGSFKANTRWQNCAPVYEGGAAYKLSDDGEYVEFTCLYPDALAPGAKTDVSLESVTLDCRIDHDGDAYFWIADNGVATPLNYSGNTVEMRFNAYAISTKGFESVVKAYDFYYNPSATPQATAEASAN